MPASKNRLPFGRIVSDVCDGLRPCAEQHSITIRWASIIVGRIVSDVCEKAKQQAPFELDRNEGFHCMDQKPEASSAP